MTKKTKKKMVVEETKAIEIKRETKEYIKECMGIKGEELAMEVFFGAAGAMHPLCGAQSGNVVVQAMLDQKPQDATEARLTAQANALYLYGMRYMKRLEEQDMINQAQYCVNTAIKLLRLHNETVQTLDRHKNRGEQRVIVQHVNVADGGKAVVGGQINQGGGGTSKLEGAPHA